MLERLQSLGVGAENREGKKHGGQKTGTDFEELFLCGRDVVYESWTTDTQNGPAGRILEGI